MRTYCNPTNLEYRFQVKGWAKECLREAADPSVAVYGGEYWLFPSKSGGYWRSSDLASWTFVPTTVLPTEDYAPDVCVIGSHLYFTASRSGKPSSIYRTTDPGADAWEHVADPFPYWDPNMFADDDGRVYLYWGCSNKAPIRGVELDPATMVPVGEEAVLIEGHHDVHGWERVGDDHCEEKPPYVEGAWMTKYGGRYYLQYAAPGTEFNVYGDGVYVGRSPLGPFEYQRHNPFSYKPGGFITGAGHGSTFADPHGNLWHVATMRISVKHMFERRVGLFPAGVDADGVMFCNTSFGDYPKRLPAGRWDPWSGPWTGWMLLSYRARASASSVLDGHAPALAVDEDVRTYFSAATGGGGEWLAVDLGARCTVNAVQVNFAEHGCDQYERAGTPLTHQYILEVSDDGGRWRTACDRRENERDVPHDYVELGAPVSARHVRITNRHMPAGGTFAISGLRVFGRGAGAPPAVAAGVTAARDAADARGARVTWGAVEGATGYNVRWGVAPGKLYASWLVYDRHELELRGLTAGTDYWLAVDAFNANGVTPGATVGVV